MSSYLEPTFLLELGAYAVAAAGIRIFKSKYWRTGVLPSAHGTPDVEEPVATVQVSVKFSCSPGMSCNQAEDSQHRFQSASSRSHTSILQSPMSCDVQPFPV